MQVLHLLDSAPLTSLQDVRLVGLSRAGIFIDELEDGLRFGGCGENPDARDEHGLSVDEQIARELAANIRHEPAEMPAQCNPFTTAEQREAFWAALYNAHIMGSLPGSLELELSANESMHESVRIGRKLTELRIELPAALWWPRIIRWHRALGALLHTQLFVK